jgi:hypothetical protein
MLNQNHKEVFESLMQRCREAKKFTVRCLLDPNTPIQLSGRSPFGFSIKDGVCTCNVIALTKREAQLKVVDTLPVLKLLEEE